MDVGAAEQRRRWFGNEMRGYQIGNAKLAQLTVDRTPYVENLDLAVV